MKTKVLLLLAFLAPFISSATIHMVNVSDFQFAPASMSGVRVGDTVMFMWVSGVHTATSSSVPSGAPTFDAPITSTNTSFSYKVMMPGVYNYVCTPHIGMGMVGSFTAVAAPTSVGNVSAGAISVYPNPAAAVMNVKFAQKTTAAVQLFNATGVNVYNASYSNTEEAAISTGNLPAGLYYVRVTTADNKVFQSVVSKY